MRKQIIAGGMIVLAGVAAQAHPLTPAQALGRVDGMVMSRSEADSAPAMTVKAGDTTTLYVFTRPEGGWMILAADDVAAPLLAYSDSGSINAEVLPDNLRGWLDSYSREIAAASMAGAGAFQAADGSATREPVEPMLATTWNQNAPYNKFCPAGTYTGCVATAMAQVMNYFRAPERAGENATFKYTFSGNTYEADFANYEFEWANMLDSYAVKYEAAQADAVAKLMQACAYSVRMRFDTTASAAYSEQAGGALATYFGYDQGLHNEFRSLHSSSEWESMIYDNLRSVGPMIYWGGVHCFVCDGYSHDGFFHFNWGWGGSADGYFLLTALAPGAGGIGSGNGDYTPNQGALLGARPATASPSKRVYTFRIDELSDANVSSALGLTIYGSFINSSPYTVSGEFVYRVFDADGAKQIATCPVTLPACKNWGIDPQTGNTVTASQMMGKLTGVADGTYRVYPGVRVDGEEYPFQCPPTIGGYVIVTIANGIPVKAEIPEMGQLIVEGLRTYGDFFAKSYYKFSGTSRFTGEGDTNVMVSPVLLTADGTVCATGTTQVSLNFSDSGSDFEFILPWFYETGQALTPGDYTFGLAQIENGRYKVLGSCPVTVKAFERGAIATPVELEVADTDAVNPDDANFTATIKGTAGAYYQSLIFTVRYGGNTVVQKEVPGYVTAGQTAEVLANMQIPSPKWGETYTVDVSRNNGGRYELISDYVSFILTDENGGGEGGDDAIDAIRVDGNRTVDYFNLQGQRVDVACLRPGLYIRRCGNLTEKIIIR